MTLFSGSGHPSHGDLPLRGFGGLLLTLGAWLGRPVDADSGSA